MKLIRVLIADDHPIVRRGLRITLEQDRELQVVAEAADGEAALELIEKFSPDVAVLDIEMPQLDGFAVVREIIKRRLTVKVIFLTLHSDEDLFRAALELGIQGYVLKDSAVQEIAAGVHAVALGKPFLSSAITARLLRPQQTVTGASKDRDQDLFTPVENQILQLIADGKSSKEIGDVLSLHYRTVENHRTNMCRKLDIEGTGALLRFALRQKTD